MPQVEVRWTLSRDEKGLARLTTLLFNATERVTETSNVRQPQPETVYVMPGSRGSDAQRA